MKRILIIDRFYFPDEQATSIYLTELTRGLRDKFIFEVLCGPPLVVTEERKPESAPIRIYRVPAPRLPKQILFGRLLNDLIFLIAAFFSGLFIRQPDLIVSQTSPPGIWWIGFLLSRWHGTPWVHVCQDLFPDNLRVLQGGANGRLSSTLEKIVLWPLHQSNRILVVGEDMRGKLLRKGFPDHRITRTHNWVDLKFVRPLPKSNAVSQKDNLENKFVILYSGNFGRIYNFEDLLGAAELLCKEPRVIFVLRGDGALKQRLEFEIQSRGLRNVLMLPFERYSKIPEVLASADVHAALLRKGMAGLSVPSKIYSILASARPVIACVEEESDIAKMVREADSGLVVPPGQPEDFARAVKALLEDGGLRTRMGRNARRYVEEKDFQTQAFADYEQAFQELTNRN